METPESRAKLAGAIRDLQAKGDTQTIERLVSAYKAKYQPEQIQQPEAPQPKEPGFVQSVAQGLASPFLKFGATVKDVGRGIGALFGGAEAQREYLQSAPSTIDAGYLGQQKAMQTPLEGLGVGIEAGSTFIGGGGIRKVATEGLKTLVRQGVKTGFKEGLKYGGASSFGQALQQEDPTVGGVLGQTTVGTLAGGLGGGVLGGAVPIISRGVKATLPKTPAALKTELDNQIKNIYRGETMGIAQLNDRALKARRGLELLQKESPNIKVPDPSAPLGSKAVKPIDLQRATPNELLSGVLEMDKKIASIARKATEKAQGKGVKIDTSDVKEIITKSIKGGEVPSATGNRMLKQIEALGDDPVKVHDWVQDINIKYGKKYQRGTIDDTITGKLADDIAEVLRGKLNSVVDRKGYAEAFGNNQELKRMLVVMAKKANKGVNFGDISTDIGLDAAISLLTGNPAFMARTIGAGLFKGIVGGIRGTSGIRTFKKALKISEKLGTKEKLPSSRLKAPKSAVQPNQTQLPQPQLSQTQGLSSPPTLPQPKAKGNIGKIGKLNDKSLEPLAAEARKYKSAEEFEKAVLNQSNISKGAKIQTIPLNKIKGTDYPELDVALKSNKDLTLDEALDIITDNEEMAARKVVSMPIEVRANADGTYNLMAGNHRLAQQLINGEKTIPASVLGDSKGISLTDFYNQAVKGLPPKPPKLNK